MPDGAYELVATTRREGGETFSSVPLRISVKGADVSGVELKLSAHGSIAGRVELESSNSPKMCAINGSLAENTPSSQVQEQTGRQRVVEEILLRADRDDPNQRSPRSRYGWFGYGRAPNEKGEFALKNLEAGRYRIAANLPDDGWYIRAIQSRQSGQSGAGASKPTARAAAPPGVAKGPVDLSRNGIAIKPGEKLSGIEVIIAEGAASLGGKIVPATEGAQLPKNLCIHLIPAEAAAADDLLRYFETTIRNDDAFEFKHIAPGKYLLHARPVAEKERMMIRTARSPGTR